MNAPAIGGPPIGLLALLLPVIAVYGFATGNGALAWPALVCGLAALAFWLVRQRVNRP